MGTRARSVLMCMAWLAVWGEQARGDALSPEAAAASAAAGAAAAYVSFGQDFAGPCVNRNGVEINVRNTHPTRTIRVWFDRYHMGAGTGDRSRSDLLPAAEPESLGCSRSEYGAQEWRLVKAQFLD